MKKAVLAVDDSKTVLNMIDLYLKDKYELICATSGNQALQILQKRTVDIILLDVMMPVMNGIMVLKKIREKEKWRDIPVLFLTGDAHKARVLESYQTGSQGYILKPVAKEDLLQRIEDGMKKQKQILEKRAEAEKKAEEAKKLLEMQRADNEKKLEEAKKAGEQKKKTENIPAEMGEISRDLQVRQMELELKLEMDREESFLGAFEDIEEILENFVKADDGIE